MKKIVTTTLVLVLILTLIQVVVSNSLSTTGVALGKLDDQISSYQKQNHLLKEKLLTSSSLAALSKEAGRLGFVPQKSTVALFSSQPLAVKP